ncbi:hypothetical protein BELL_0006g00410 [Botrytis elliptica]|uniref:Uncharacterized protein n=1 Tax=Botrytis elliptica TaxID=278938 RepID=A0A4Z1K4P7_9HELO|nr:hypothetical protein BELL_0006g00410 [Botrytis elliptica]
MSPARPADNPNDGGGDNGGDNNDDDDDKNDNSGKGRRKDERRADVTLASLPAIRAEERRRSLNIIPPRKRATRIIRRRAPDHQEDVSKKALSGQAKGRQQYPLRLKALEMDSRIKAEKVTRDRFSKDEYEEDEDF